MSTITILLGITAVVIFNTLIAYLLGWIFTEVSPLPWSRKPFNCRGCLTFWLTVLFNGCFSFAVAWRIALIASPAATVYGITTGGILCGLISFLYIKSKFQVNE